jgi:NAD(P)-dependent dehydrogenase (short-subunit alcohol dehydrogenase family)
MNLATSKPLADRVAIVTGALGLLGQEHCAALAAAGANVIVADLDLDRARHFGTVLENTYGAPALGGFLDVTEAASVDALKDAVLDRFGRIDVLVNNAAIDDKFDPGAGIEASRFEAYALERFRRQLEVNVTGVFLCCQRIGTWLAERGSGSIINVASTYGVVAPDQSLYRRPDGSQAFFKGPAYRRARAPYSSSRATSPLTGAGAACASTRSARAAWKPDRRLGSAARTRRAPRSGAWPRAATIEARWCSWRATLPRT